MQTHHWLLLAVLMVAGYFVGAKYPQLAHKVGVA